MTVVIVACSNDAQEADDPAAAGGEDTISDAPVDPDDAADPDAPAEPGDELDERGPEPEVVPYEELTRDEQDGTQDLCAEVAWGDPIEAVANGPPDNLPEYLEWVIADPSAEERAFILALNAACNAIGWPPEM